MEFFIITLDSVYGAGDIDTSKHVLVWVPWICVRIKIAKIVECDRIRTCRNRIERREVFIVGDAGLAFGVSAHHQVANLAGPVIEHIRI